MKILIAEDDSVSRILLRSILSSEPGWSVVEAVNGRVAWDVLDKGLRPDVAILDVMMPELDGIELIKKIRNDARLRALKIVLCSTLNDRNIIKQAASLGVSYYLLKPISRINVLDQLRKVQAQISSESGMEPASAVCDRLGINHDLYNELVASLPNEVIASIKAIHDYIKEGQMMNAFSRISALRSAAVNLGAIAISDKTAQAETILTPEAAKIIDNQTDAAEREKRAKVWMDSQGKHLDECLDRISKEGHRLNQWLESRRDADPSQSPTPQEGIPAATT